MCVKAVRACGFTNTDWIAIAFMRGTPGLLRHTLIANLTWGPYVHSEILLGRERTHSPPDIRAYSAQDGISGLRPSKYHHSGPEWTIIKYPLPPSGYEMAYAIILRILSENLQYNHRDLWQCCIQMALPFEKDLDCEHPETWQNMGGVFCSQVSLLFLRKLIRAGTVVVPVPIQTCIEQTNSRGCSPNGLFRLLTRPV